MEPDEAVDLILTLPRGSMWRSSQVRFGELSDEDERAYDLIDEVRRFMHLYATGSTEGASTVTRPDDMRARANDAKRSRDAMRRIENTQWEEV